MNRPELINVLTTRKFLKCCEIQGVLHYVYDLSDEFYIPTIPAISDSVFERLVDKAKTRLATDYQKTHWRFISAWHQEKEWQHLPAGQRPVNRQEDVRSAYFEWDAA